MRTLTVVGHGAGRAAPDAAVLRLAAVHRGAGLADALAGAESVRAEIVAVAGASATAAVASQDLSVWPAQDHRGRPDGFEARHALSVRCADLDEAGVLVGRLAAAVGDRLVVEGVALVVSDDRPARAEARETAYADARLRAEHLAGLAGAELGDVQSVTEGGDGPSGAPRALAASLKGGATFVPGETTVEQALTVTFQLR